jgi:TRAF3-interacting protein 1
MIELVSMMLDEQLDVKASKIVAGLEPEKTNLFLQYLFQCATSGVDSAPYVQSLLGGG